MDQDAIIQYITDTFAGVEVLRPDDGPGAGDTFFFTAAQRDIDPTRRHALRHHRHQRLRRLRQYITA